MDFIPLPASENLLGGCGYVKQPLPRLRYLFHQSGSKEGKGICLMESP